MGIRMHPGLKEAGIDPKMIDQLIDVQKVPIESAKKRREQTELEKAEYTKLDNMLQELDASLSQLKTRADFYKLKVDSSHPDIIDGTAGSLAMVGIYEMEVRALARSEKELAYGFPDRNDTPVGFGYMLIERDDLEEIEIVVEPYTTLEEVAQQINDAEAGVRAIVINTKYQPDPYRLLVISEQSGKEAKVYLDEDTTFLEFKEQVTGRNLDVLFEDVPITDEDNILDELLDDVIMHCRRSEPGTRVQVHIGHDIDETVKGIQLFVDNYNQIAQFVNNQFIQDPETGQYGMLAGDGAVKMVMRQLQGSLLKVPLGGDRFNTIAEVGITTNPKTGELMMDEAKVRKALAENYDSVARLFIRSKDRTGLAESVSQKVTNLRDRGFGVVKTRLRALDKIIKTQDQEIERRERQLVSREEEIRRQFTSLETTLVNLKGQSDFLKARFGGGGGAQGSK